MIFSTNLITSLIEYINQDDKLSLLGKAIRAYDTEGLPVPIRETYLSFSCKENSVIFSDTGETNEITVKLNCFSPLSKAAYGAHSIAEKVTAGLCKGFGTSITAFSVGDTEYDDDIKSYKITAIIKFKYVS